MPSLNLTTANDIPTFDGTSDFRGGMVSNSRANLLQPNECSYLENMDISISGELVTRRGIKQLGESLDEVIQGIAYYLTPTSEELIIAAGGILRAFNGTDWVLAGGTTNHISPYAPAVFVQGIDILYIAQSDSQLQYYQHGTVATFPVTAQSERSRVYFPEVAFTGGSAADDALANTYFLIYDENGSVGVWFNFDGTGIDPGVGDREIEVPVTSGSVYQDIATAVYNAINADVNAKFTAYLNLIVVISGVNAASVDIVCNAAGSRTDIASGTSGLDCVVLIQGRGLNELPPENMSLLCWHTDRLIGSGISSAPDTVYFSQFLDGSLWDRANWSIRVGAGEGDPITALVPWTNYNLIVVKQHSIWIVDCNPPTPPIQFVIHRVHDRIGSMATNTWYQVGTDVFGLTTSGVRSVANILASEQQKEVGPALSYPVDDIIKRITLSAIRTSCAFHWNNRYILALPLDGAAQPNYILVFNTLTSSWSGVWTGWLPTYFTSRVDGGVPKLCFTASDTTVSDWMDYVPLNQDTHLAYLDQGNEIECKVVTRAFIWNEPVNSKSGFTVEFEMDNSRADAVVQVIRDGADAEAFERFPSLAASLSLPLTLPFTLPRAGIVRKPFNLERYDPFRELQFQVQSFADKLELRQISASAFTNTFVGQ